MSYACHPFLVVDIYLRNCFLLGNSLNPADMILADSEVTLQFLHSVDLSSIVHTYKTL